MAFQWGKFSPAAYRSIIGSTARINVWDGSVRSSKTISSIVRWIEIVKKTPKDVPKLMSGRTERTLRLNILNDVINIVGSKNASYNRGTGTFTLYGHDIECVGASDERAQEKIRGRTLGLAYVDEITLLPESFWTMLLSRLSIKGAKLFGTTNPDSPYHWLKTNYLDRTGELDLKRFKFKIDDNPNLDPEYVKALKAEYTGLWYKRFILGLWVQAEGAVYDMWDETKYVIDTSGDKYHRFFVSVDYGTSNPTVFGLFGHSGSISSRPAAMIKEYYHDGRSSGRQKTDAQYADDFKQWLGGTPVEAVYVDPSAASFIAELRTRGVPVVEANNAVIDGIRFVSGLLSSGKFLVDRKCKETRKEFSSYVWDPKAQRAGEDRPMKTNDHCVDMVRYGLFTRFFREHKQFLAGFNYN